MSLNAVSLFAGVGGIDLALHQAGIPTVAAVEIDNAARGVLAHRFPQTTLYTDVTKVEPDDLLAAGFVPRDGILTGGFPCQDLSVAGARAGLAGARSGLFWHIVRLAEALQPQWLLLENVPGLLSSNGGRDMGTVIGALVECGYGIAWRVLDAQHFGVPQRRRRVVIVGCLGDNGRASSSVLALAEGGRRDPASRRTPGQDIAHALTARLGASGPDDNAAQSGHLIATYGRNQDSLYSELNVSSTITDPRRHVTPLVAFSKAKRAQTVDDDETWTVARVSPMSNALSVGDTRATTLAVPIGFSHTAGIEPQASSEVFPTVMAGHGRMPAVLAFDEYNQTIGPVHHTLRSAVSAAGSGILGAGVRRLTPTECERLQGFPDGWTAQRLDPKKGVIGQADAPRYKQMGNAVAVPVFEWVARRIVTAHEELK